MIYNSVTDLPPADLMAGFTNQEFLTTSLDLSEGIHNLKLEVEDRAGNISHDFLLNVEIDTTVPIAGDPDLIDSSDSGMSNTDNVTNKMQPAFYGRSEANTTVRVFAQPVDRNGNVLGDNVLVGQGTVGSDQSDITAGGAADDGLGVWEVTVEPLDDGIYDITVQIEDWAGNSDTSANPLTIEIDTLEPNTPLLDKISPDDNGHSDTDNITNLAAPTFTMTTQDPNQAEHISQFNYKFRIYDRLEGQTETLIYNSVTALPPAQLMQGLTNQEFLTTTLNLAEGVHNLKLEVEDRAGNISHDFLLDVEIDLTPPVAGEVDMIGSSDSGMSSTDNVTSITRPAFFGRSEVNSSVRVFAEPVDRLGNSLGDRARRHRRGGQRSKRRGHRARCHQQR